MRSDLRQDAPVADYGYQKIRGWRSRLDDAMADLRKRVWEAPAAIVYCDGRDAPRSDSLVGVPRWFNRVFGQERIAASADLREARGLRRRIRASEATEDHLIRMRAWFRQWRAKQSDEWRSEQAMLKRLRRAAKPEMYKAIDKRSKERTRDVSNARRRAAHAVDPEKARSYQRANRAARRNSSDPAPSL